MKTQSIKDLLKDYKREIDYIDFDDDLELLCMFAVRGQLIDRYEELTENDLNNFNKLEERFISFDNNLKGFEKKLMVQNSELYKKMRKVA